MVNYRIVAKVFSQALIAEGGFMLLSAFVSLAYHEPFGSLVISGLLTIIAGGMVYSPLKKEERINGNKEGIITLAGTWIILGLAGTLPYMLTGTITNFGDAFFESVSGFTTTGASIIRDVEACSHGILFWRSSTQWMGGLLFILVSLSIIPIKQINIQLLIEDFTGASTDKINPRTFEISKRLIAIYLTLTLVETILLAIGGMGLFDALCHSLSTISTGGFSTKNGGIMAFDTPYILVILTLFMFVAGSNLTLIYFGFKKKILKITRNHEFLLYTALVLLFSFAGFVSLYNGGFFTLNRSILEGLFHTVSMISTTGYRSVENLMWSPFILFGSIVLMIIGSSSGSAGGGLKVIRLLISGKIANIQMKGTLHPNAVLPLRLGKKVIPGAMAGKVLIIITLYFIVICASTVILSFFGHDLIASFGIAASMLSNVGSSPVGLGPYADYQSMTMLGKQFLVLLMLLGRLEFLSLIILFTGGFYKR